MNREKKLVKNTFIITIGKISTQLITFLLLPLYTGILSTDEYGIVDLLNTLVGLLLPIITFQVEQAIFRELIEVRTEEDKKKRIISSGVVTVIVQCFIYLLIFSIITQFINNKYKIFLATNVIANIFLSLFQQIARGLGNNKEYAIGSFISSVCIIIFNIILLIVVKLGATGMLLGTLFGQCVGILYLFLNLKLYRYIRISQYKKSTMKSLWKYSIPLIPNAISWWIFNASDRVIASSFLGMEQNGILAAALKFSAIYITLYNIFNIGWTESISIAIDDKDIDNYFNNTFNIIFNLFVSLAIGIITCMPFVFPLMINNNYSSGYGLVPISIIASLFNVIVGLISVIYVAKKNTKAIANTSGIAAILNITAHLLLINYIGLYAAVVSTLISYAVMSIYRLYDIKKKYFKITINKVVIIKLICVLPIVLFSYYYNNFYLNIFSLVVAIIFALNINKELIGNVWSFFKKKMAK